MFFLGVYIVLAIPFMAMLAILAWILRKRRVSRAKSILIFTAAAVLALSPFATQMASLYVGIAPMGYFILAMPFEAKGAAAFFIRVYFGFLAAHLIGMALVAIVSSYVAHKVFPR